MPLPIRQTIVAILLVCASQVTSVTAAEDDSASQPWRLWHGILFRVVPPAPAAASPTPASTSAGGSAAESAAEPAAEPAAEGPVSYLFGSIHYGTMDELDLDPAVLQDVLRTTQTLVSEADAETRFDSSYDTYRFLSPGLTMKRLLGAPAFEELKALLPAIKPEQLDRFKPWLILALLESRGEIASENNLDGQILQWSKEAQLKQAHLETLREQMIALDCIPEREHALVLSQRIAEPWVLRESSERVLGYYRNRDLVGWLDEVDAVVGLDPQGRGIETRARQCLLDERNARWLARLEPMLKAGRCFVAVGAIHLAGEDGLLNQLSRRGYRIVAEPI